MRYLRYIGVFVFALLLLAPQASAADAFMTARIQEVAPFEASDETSLPLQRITLQVTSGMHEGEIIAVIQEDRSAGDTSAMFSAGDTVTVRSIVGPNGDVTYVLDDWYRLPSLGFLFLIFFSLAVLFAGWRGVGATLGMVLSVVILFVYVVPQILGGANPLAVTLFGGLVISVVTMFLAHGFSRQTLVALSSTAVTLFLALGIAEFFVRITPLFGFGSEGVFLLQGSGAGITELRGLLLGGIVIGMLGVLDDVTTAQTEAVHQIHAANTSLSRSELYRRGLRVGREHIASLVNTLVLAYAGTSLAVFLLLSLNETEPLWVVLNSEIFAEEFVRMLSGSIALILAVPIATYAAAWFFANISTQKQRS